MLKGIRQYDYRLLRVIQKYGCLFLCFAEASPILFEGKEGIEQLNKLWMEAEDKGIISGDINQDGDYDEKGEAEVQDHTSLAHLFNLKVHYDDIHHDAAAVIPPNIVFVIGKYFWKSGHFVLIDHDKNVLFDPLGFSNTVKNGALQSMRWYYAD